MKYDFTTVPNRRNVGSVKWIDMLSRNPDVDEDVVPLSVADMEFLNAPEITKGLQKYIGNMVLGYTNPTEAYYDAVIQWMKKHHDYEIKQEWIALADGVVPALGDLIRALSEPGDGVIIMSPVYYPFRLTIEGANRTVIDNPLLLTEKGYEIDYTDLEEKAKDEKTKLMIFCNPHNPVGRVWTREELSKVMDICIRNHVFVIDDEIHHDLIMPGVKHTVMATLSEEAAMNCAVCTAPSKTFNLAGLQTSNIIIRDLERKKAFVEQRTNAFRLNLNAVGPEACRLAYTECEEWLEECIQVINKNAEYVTEFMKVNMPEIRVFPLEGTYLLWADFRDWGFDYEALEKFMINDAQIFMDEGYMFGDNGKGFERFNLACPFSVIEKTMNRLLEARDKMKK